MASPEPRPGREERRDLCCSLELGGKSAAIILPDADLAATIERLRYGAFFSSGQSCVLTSRILVPRSRHDAFVAAIRKASSARWYPNVSASGWRATSTLASREGRQ